MYVIGWDGEGDSRCLRSNLWRSDVTAASVRIGGADGIRTRGLVTAGPNEDVEDSALGPRPIRSLAERGKTCHSET